MEFIVAWRAELSPTLLAEVSAYRYGVFVRKLGWRLPNARCNSEQDEFDTDDALYIIARSEEGTICGFSRLLPTTQPYLLQSVFPQLIANQTQCHCSARVWELSRFAACALTPNVRFKTGTSLVFSRAAQAAKELGARYLIGVLSPSLERVLVRTGAHLRRIGGPTMIGGEQLIACEVGLERAFEVRARGRREMPDEPRDSRLNASQRKQQNHELDSLTSR